MRILPHLSALALVTILLVTVYGSVQQSYRASANDPQRQLAEDLKEKWQKGLAPDAYFSDSVDLNKSLATFTILYDSAGRPLRSSGFLNGVAPHLPKGVFRTAEAGGSDWLTWQPQHNVRVALGVVRVDTHPVSYVAVGRSLRAVEEREFQLRLMILVGWSLCVFVICANAGLPLIMGVRSE